MTKLGTDPSMDQVYDFLKEKGLLDRCREITVRDVRIVLAEPDRTPPDAGPVEVPDIERIRTEKNAALERDLLGRTRLAQRS